jgi:maltose O-acetyltransferase
VRFVGGCDVSIGDFSFVSSGVVFDARAHIEVGTRVAIGPNAMLLTSTHEIGPSDHRAGGGYAKFAPIVVEDGCWIGAGAIILPGVTVGRGCIVGAGAVVTKDCEPDGLYTGVPATRKRNLPIATAAVDLGSERTLGRLLAAEGGFAATFERPFEG